MPLLLAVFLLCVAFGSHGSAEGVDRVFTKEAGQKSWGEVLYEYFSIPRYNKSYALIIGISSFHEFDDLPSTQDPIRMKDYLIREAGFDYVHMITEDKVTGDRIRELMLDDFPSRLHESDRFLFYWSGHGITRSLNNGRKHGYLPLSYSRTDRYADMISMEDIQRWDSLLTAKQVLYLLDACFSGLAGSVAKSAGDYKVLNIEQLSQPSRHMLTAGTEDERAIVVDRLGGSLFTAAVLDGLRGAADASSAFPNDGVVSLNELKGYVGTRVASERRKSGWKGTITPQLRDLSMSNGEFFFITSTSRSTRLQNPGSASEHVDRHEAQDVIGKSLRPPMSIEYDGRDERAFRIISESNIVSDFYTFMDEYPDSVYVPYIKNRLAALQKKTSATVQIADPANTGRGRKIDSNGCLREADGQFVIGFRSDCK